MLSIKAFYPLVKSLFIESNVMSVRFRASLLGSTCLIFVVAYDVVSCFFYNFTPTKAI